MTEPPIFRFSIVRLVPSPIRGERFNIGVVVWGNSPVFFGARIASRTSLNRLRRPTRIDDFSFVTDLATSLKSSEKGEHQLDVATGHWDSEVLTRAIGEWANVVQFSELHPAQHDDPGRLLDELFAEYVAAPRRPPRGFRDKRWVKAKVSKALSAAVAGDPSLRLETQYRVGGKFEEHSFDFAVLNGVPVGLVQTFSFDVPDRVALQLAVDATAWAIEDLRKAGRHTPTTVVTIGDRRARLLERAERMYTGLGAEVVREPGLTDWLERAPAALRR